MKKKPNFLVVGVPKAGTSSLHAYLKGHPDIFLTDQKELHFFSSQQLQSNLKGPGDKEAFLPVIKNWGQYTKLFNSVTTEKAIGDISPSYFYFSEHTIPKIKEQLGAEIKIIITLRDPIARLHSQYLHQTRLMLETESLENALLKSKARKTENYGDFWQYMAHSLYVENCQRFIDAFGADNVKIVVFEDLVKLPKETLHSIFKFLNVDAAFVPDNIGATFNKGGFYKKNKLTAYLLKPTPVKQFLYKHLGRFIGGMYSRYKNSVLQKNTLQKPTIPEEILQNLKTYFKEDVNMLKESFGVDTSKWNNFS